MLDWRLIQLGKLRNVEVMTGLRLGPQEVREYGAELVVVATGARWAADGLNCVTHEAIAGADATLPHVLTPEQVLVEGKPVPGRRVLVYDGDGYFMAPGLAEKLAADGYEVHLATCHHEIAPFCYETLEQHLLRRRMHESGIRQRAGVLLTRIAPGRVEAVDEFEEPLAFEVDAVVLCTQRLSNEELYLDLKADEQSLRAEGIEALYRIGDCVAPQLIADCIFDGHRLAREIDAADPATPMPYLRERAAARGGGAMSEFRSPLASDANAGRVALVTGGGTGIGRATALELARTGAAVAICGRRPEPLEATRAEIEAAGGSCLAVPTDVREPEQVDALLAGVLERYERIDVLVNNAGGQFIAPAEDISPNGWRAVQRLNVDAVWYLTRAVATAVDDPGRRRADRVHRSQPAACAPGHGSRFRRARRRREPRPYARDRVGPPPDPHGDRDAGRHPHRGARRLRRGAGRRVGARGADRPPRPPRGGRVADRLPGLSREADT